jgi:Tfp pilus assembly protein PilE
MIKHEFANHNWLKTAGNESGRSLIEMLGVLAIGGIITFGAIKTYQTVRARQARFVAEQDMKELADNAKIIYSGRKNYSGISKNYLIKTGALKIEKINGHDFRIDAGGDGKSFAIIFDDLDIGDCAYFATKNFDWADGVAVNGIQTDPQSMCIESAPNKLEFIVK